MSPTTPPRPELDPEAGAVWRAISEGILGGRSTTFDERALAAARSLAGAHRDALLDVRSFTDRELRIPGPAGPVSVTVLTPDTHVDPAPGIFWVHGGGMVVGTRFGAVEALEGASAVGAVIVSIEYRLAPDHPAPAPGDDCYASLCWLGEHAAEVGVDPARIVLGGASAGAGLAAATALRVRDHGGPDLAGLLLCCPMLDDRMTSVSSNQFGEDIVWTRASNAFGWRALLGPRAGTDAVTIHEAPGRATDLQGLPPTFVDVGSADLFRDEAVAFASTIWASGGDAELHVWPGGYHGFEMLAPAAALSVDAVTARRRWLERTLAKASVQRTNGPVGDRDGHGP